MQTLEVGTDLGSMLITEVAIFLESFINDLFEVRWKIWIQLKGGNGSAVENGFENESGRLAGKWQAAGNHFV